MLNDTSSCGMRNVACWHIGTSHLHMHVRLHSPAVPVRAFKGLMLPLTSVPCFLLRVGNLQLEISCRALLFVCILPGEGLIDCMRACWRPRSTSMSSSVCASAPSASSAGFAVGMGSARLNGSFSACFLADRGPAGHMIMILALCMNRSNLAISS